MDKLVLDPATLEKLRGIQTVTELFDAGGRSIGMFCPVEKQPAGFMTDEEIDASFANFKRGRKWEDIRADLMRMKR